MTRRVSVVAAIMAVATSVLVPGMAWAQTGSPPAVAGVVVERPPAPVAVAGETLPRTGSELIPMVGVALALVVLGVVLVLSVRRRRGDDNLRLA